MNPEENLFNSISNIFEKIIEKESAEQNEPKESKQNNSALNAHLNGIDARNQNTYDELIKLYERIKASNSPISETIKHYEEFINHIEELLEVKKISPFQPDINFCQAIFNLKNFAIEDKLQLKISTGFNIGEQNKGIPEHQESDNKLGYKEYNKPAFTTYQILFLMNELRKLRFTISDLTNTKMAHGINTLTGYSVNTLRPDLGKIISGEITLSDNDKNQLKEILSQLGKAVDKI